MVPSSKPKVSIIIATLNADKTLTRCLDSILNQNYKNIEIIIFDALSKDRTIEIIKNYNLDIIHWKSESDSGIYNAWNKGIKEATGDWLCFIGADDYYLYDNSLSLMMEKIDDNPLLDYITFRGNKVNEAGKIISVHGLPRNWKTNSKRFAVCHPGSLYNKNLFVRFGKFSEDYKISSDYEFDLRMGQDIQNSHIDKALINIQEGGISRKEHAKVFKEHLDIQLKYINPAQAYVNFLKKHMEHMFHKLFLFFGIQRHMKSILTKTGLMKR